MNTRLQVEHPVTEAVTGVDIVRGQLLAADGQRLRWTQSSLVQRGHAVECRVYAEDPRRDFLPQAGPLVLYREPAGPGLRVDSGVVQGDAIGVDYDPLIAKVIAYAESRDAALDRAAAALRDFPILGIRTNLSFLITLLENPHVRQSATHTTFVDDHLDELTDPGELPVEAIAAAGHARSVRNSLSRIARTADSGQAAGDGLDPWQTLSGWGR
jgi:acetyl/propionyl-CoA carboxylase alpha subunit